MQICYPPMQFPSVVTKSIFLAGPTPRSDTIAAHSWRKDAIAYLADIGFDGVIYSPEPPQWLHEYVEQIEWERAARTRADVILYWIPRDLETMPAFTTNVEFGDDYKTGRMVYGRPPDAPKNRYLDCLAEMDGITIHQTLEDTITAAVVNIGPGALRRNGECTVPLNVWKTPQFSSWYASLKNNGNRLDDSKVQDIFIIPKANNMVFSYRMWVKIWVGSEKRYKENEFIFSRTDISTVVAYSDTRIVLIKEFRSPVRNTTGYVWEAPGGSSFKPGTDVRTVAAKEFFEETSVLVNPDRIRYVNTRQSTATLSTHCIHVFAVKLSEHEVDYMETLSGTAQGVVEDSERTYVEVIPRDRLYDAPLDWSMVGLISEAINS